jgi:hypothetical protein
MSSPHELEHLGDSLESMRARLEVLQPSLEGLMQKALGIFDDVYPIAPHPSVSPDFPVYATHTADWCGDEKVPKGRELTIVLDAGKWIRIFRNTESSPDAFPRQRLWYSQTVDDGGTQKTNVIRTHSPTRIDSPYDIDVATYDQSGVCTGFIGYGYKGQDPFILAADTALDEASQLISNLRAWATE